MPVLDFLVNETTQLITRPVVYDIVEQLSKLTGMGENRIVFNGDENVYRTNGSVYNSDERGALFKTQDMVLITVTEDYNLDMINYTDIRGNEREHLFFDDKLNVFITPTAIPIDVEIQFTMRSPSKLKVSQWRDGSRLRCYKMDDLFFHDITYSYKIDDLIFAILSHVHENRELTDGYGETFEEYFAYNSNGKVKVVSDITNKKSELLISETQSRVQGFFNFDAVADKPEYDQSTGLWSLSFTYKFCYDKPFSTIVRYPIIVHNNLMPKELVIANNSDYDAFFKTKEVGKRLRGLYEFEANTVNQSNYDKDLCLTIPSYDDFIVEKPYYGTGTILTALCTLEEDKRTLLNLRELGDITIDKDVLDFISNSEYPFINEPGKSPIFIELYINDKSYTSVLEIDKDLNIKSNIELSNRNEHRIRLSLLLNYGVLSSSSIDRLLNNPNVLVTLISSVNDYLRVNQNFQDLRGLKKLDKYMFIREFGELTGLRTGKVSGGYNWLPGITDKRIPDGLLRNKKNFNNISFTSISAGLVFKPF